MDDDSGGMRPGKRKERVQEVEEGYILGRKCRELPKNMPTSFRLAEVALFCASSTPMYYLLPENITFIHRDNNSSSPRTPSATMYIEELWSVIRGSVVGSLFGICQVLYVKITITTYHCFYHHHHQKV